ncbi:MAG: LytR/AlgR family response regulator transcription factor [Bacteroidota bacterium]
MIQALIIEDEKPAAAHLISELNKLDTEIFIAGQADSVQSSCEWLENNPPPDIIFMDIQLGDGLSFDIFKQTTLPCPVIFTTAYEEYAIKAFKVNSIDYLLKPVDQKSLQFALEKFSQQNLPNKESMAPSQVQINEVIKMLGRNYKSRFAVKVGEHIRSISSEHVSCFFYLKKGVFLVEKSGKSYDIPYSLEQLETMLDPGQFFRISRQHIVNFKAIDDIITYSGSRLKVVIHNFHEGDVFVSRNRMGDFKQWLDR